MQAVSGEEFFRWAASYGIGGTHAIRSPGA